MEPSNGFYELQRRVVPCGQYRYGPLPAPGAEEEEEQSGQQNEVPGQCEGRLAEDIAQGAVGSQLPCTGRGVVRTFPGWFFAVIVPEQPA